jgi:hypothetical protein
MLTKIAGWLDWPEDGIERVVAGEDAAIWTTNYDAAVEEAINQAALSGKIAKLSPSKQAAIDALVDEMLGDES